MNSYPRLKPRTPFIPTIIEAIKNPGKDRFEREFINRLGEKLAKRMIDAWEALPNRLLTLSWLRFQSCTQWQENNFSESAKN